MSKKIEELERRIRELEARPVYVPIYVGSPLPSYPPAQPSPWFRQPWYTSQPITWTTGAQQVLNTAGYASADNASGNGYITTGYMQNTN